MAASIVDPQRTLGGRYRLSGLIGSGGMSEVHRAYDFGAGRDVAVKLLRGDAAALDAARLHHEVEVLRRIVHPNVVRLLDEGVDAGRTWFAMELVPGPDLRAVLRRRGRLHGASVRRVLAGVAAALERLHDEGLVHRDVKPANVLLTAEPDEGPWEVRLADFGIARIGESEHLTAPGAVIGTPGYLSPEQVSGAPVTAATDVFALGLLALEALTGAVPYPGTMAESAAARLLRGPTLPSGLDPAWRSLLLVTTDVRPAGRPSAGRLSAMIAALPDDALALPQDPAAAPTAVLLVPDLLPDEATQPITMRMPILAPPRRRRAGPVTVLTVAASIVCAVALVGSVASAIPGLERIAAAASARGATSGATEPTSRSAPSATPSASSTTSSTAGATDQVTARTGAAEGAAARVAPVAAQAPGAPVGPDAGEAPAGGGAPGAP